MLDSKYKDDLSTAARRHADDLFVERFVERFVLPLREELACEVEGFRDMDGQERFVHVLALNAPVHGIGDCLPFGGALVYAGVRLGRDVSFKRSDVEVSQYQPRFSDRRQLDSYALFPEPSHYFQTFSKSSCWSAPKRPSRLHEFLVGELEVHEYDTGERITYGDLPAPYRAALLALYLGSRIVEHPDTIARFILGDAGDRRFAQRLAQLGFEAGTIHSRDYLAVPSVGADGMADGWLVRIPCTRPGRDYGIALAARLRKSSEVFGPDGVEGDHDDGGAQAKCRQPDPRVEDACRWMHDYILGLRQQGVPLDGRRADGVGFDSVVRDMQLALGADAPEWSTDTARKNYSNYLKRYGLK